jgi:hypothetical protein
MRPDGIFHEGPDGVLIVAADVTSPEFEVEGEPSPSIIYRSADGVDWGPPSQPPAFGGELPGAFRVTATDTGFLLVARVQEPRPGADGPSELVIWTSPDGDIWEQVDSVLPFGPPLDDAHEDFEAISGHSVVIVLGQAGSWIIEADQ